MQTINLSDGRTLAYDTYGDLDGVPVVFSHGFGDSRLIRNPDDALTRSLGVHIIAPDEPGVGGSSPKPGRKMVEWGADIEQLADALGLGEFVVAGHSGGGPHALSIAVHLGDRVAKGVLASPVGPFDRDDYVKSLVNSDLKMAAKIRRLHPIVRWVMKMEAKVALKDISDFMAKTAKGDESDAPTFFADPDQTDMFQESFSAGFANDGEGVQEMFDALWGWGFEIGDVKQPMTIFYGDDDDIIDPAAVQKLAVALPNASTTAWPGAGHYGFVDSARWKQFLGAMT